MLTRQNQPPEVLYKKVVLKNFAIFTQKRPQNWVFLVNIAKLLRAPVLKNVCQRLLLTRETFKGIYFVIVH